jgi:FG-GAP repeat protein
MNARTLRNSLPVVVGLMLFAAASTIQAQSPIVFSQTLTPTTEDVESAPFFSNISFGAAVSISGRTAMVGMPNHNNVGRVGVYTRTAEGWVRTATLSGSSSDVRFGRAIDLNGNVAVIGASQAAYLYRKQGHQWRQLGKVELQSPSVSDVAYDNGVIAVGSTDFNAPGVVYIYEHEPKQGLRLIATLSASDASANDGFGASLAMERDVLVVGAPNLGAIGSGVVPGAAFVFARRGHQWIEQQTLVGSDALPGSAFGASVAIRNRAILVGAPYRDAPGETCIEFFADGNAYVFLPYRGTWFESQTLNSDAQFCAHFGNDVAMGRGLVAVGIPFIDPVLGSDGEVLAFDWLGQELRSVRRVIQTGAGESAADLDFSGRTLIAGILNSEALEGVQIGHVQILEFGRE